jgi:hypothetical protein
MAQAISSGVISNPGGAEHFGTFTRIVNLGGIMGRAFPRTNEAKTTRPRPDEKGNVRSTNLSLLVACATCSLLFMVWSVMPVGGNMAPYHEGFSLAIVVEDVVVPNWLLGVGAVSIYVLLRWREAVHPFRSILFATVINAACIVFLIALVSRGCPLATTSGVEVEWKLNVIPYLILALFVLQQVELIWRTLVFLFFLVFSFNRSARSIIRIPPVPAAAAIRGADAKSQEARKSSRNEPAFLLHKLVRMLPGGLGDEIEAESRSWFARCRCGCERSIWDLGGIRYKGKGEPRRFLHCPECDQNGWHKVILKDDFPKDVA